MHQSLTERPRDRLHIILCNDDISNPFVGLFAIVPIDQTDNRAVNAELARKAVDCIRGSARNLSRSLPNQFSKPLIRT